MKYILFILILSTKAFAVSDSTKLVTNSEITATATSTKFLDQDSKRNYLLILNRGAVSVYMKFGSEHAGGEVFLIIPAGGSYEPYKVPDGSVYLKAASGTAAMTILAGDAP